MGRSTRNTYAKALKHLKSSHEDVTYNMLGEDAPTNSTSGLYRLEPDEVIIDPNGADPVDFGEDPAAWEARMQELLGDYVPYDGTDTSGLFEDDGRIRTVEFHLEILHMFWDLCPQCIMGGVDLLRLDILDSLTEEWLILPGLILH